MKKIIFIIATLLIFISCEKDKEENPEPVINYLGSWQLKNSSAISKRMHHVGAAVNGKGYIGLGNEYSASAVFLKDWWEYDPLNDSWTQKTNFIGNSDNSQKAVATMNFVYVIDSINIYSFDTDSNIWIQKSSYPGLARKGYALVATDNGLFIGMGNTDTFPSSPLNDWWYYDETADQWTQKLSFPGLGLGGPLSYNINNKIYVGNGSYIVNNSSTRDYKLWSYTIATDQWDFVTDIPESSGSGYGFTLNQKGYFAGGVLVPINTGLCEYNPSDNSWKSYYDVKFSYGAAFFTINNKLYLFQSFSKYAQDNTSIDEKFWALSP